MSNCIYAWISEDLIWKGSEVLTTGTNGQGGNAIALDLVRIVAPKDCTQDNGLRLMVKEARKRIRMGTHEFVLDLSCVDRMNARLLATVLLLTREVRRAGGHLRLEGAGNDFRKWARTYHLLRPLERRGIIEKHIVQPVKVA